LGGLRAAHDASGQFFLNHKLQGFVSALQRRSHVVTKPIPSLAIAVLAGLTLVLASGTALGGEFNPLGDGSGTNNPDLLRDPTTGCENCETVAPHEWDAPPFAFDWSLALRGAYVRDKNGDHFEALAVPSVSLKHEFLRGSYSFSGSAELSKSTVETYRINALRLGVAGEYQVNTDLTLSGAANFALLTPSASTTGYPATTASASQEVTGDVEGSAAYDFGLLTTTLTGSASRSVYGPTTLADSSQIDNSANNNWQFGSSLRVGYAVTPLLTVFAEGRAGYQLYDTIAPSYGVRLDAADYAMRGGLASKWSEVLEAEASVGAGYRHFTFGAADDIISQLYDASITFRPDETVEMRGALATTVGAPGPNASGAARIEYAATGDIGYRVNPWVKLRANAGYRYAIFSDSTNTETGYGAGAGVDYLLNENMVATGDYNYSATIANAGAADEEHRVTLGVTLKR
jgi:hypothetical protein